MTSTIVKVTDYDQFREKISEVQEACNFLPDVSNEDGYAKSKRVALDVQKIITAVENKRVELKSASLAYGKMVDNDAKQIKAELVQLQLPHKEAYKDLDDANKKREAERKNKLEIRVQEMRDLPRLMEDSDSDGIKMALEDLNSIKCDDFYEYTMEALKVKKRSVEQLVDLFTKTLKSEEDKDELDRLRAEAAERAQKDHDDKIAREAAENARADAELLARIEADAASKRESDAKAATERAEQQKLDAEYKAKRDAESARIAADEAEKRRVADIAATEARVKREAEEAKLADEEATKARESDKKHKARVNNEVLAGLLKIEGLGLTKDEGKLIIKAICKGKIHKAFIRY